MTPLNMSRCVASENECAKLREKAVEVRRKLDDTQGALQELGRENQTLQVGQNITCSRLVLYVLKNVSSGEYKLIWAQNMSGMVRVETKSDWKKIAIQINKL